MIMAQNTAKHTQVITLDMQRTHTRAHIHYIVAGSSIAPATASACGRPLTAAATTAQVKPKAMGAGAGASAATGDDAERARKMKPIQKQTPGATASALDEY